MKHCTHPQVPPAVFTQCLCFLLASKPLPPAPAPDEYLVSPITGEKIPASKMQEHMRIGLLDPRWLEQRDRSIREKQSDDEVYAPGEVKASESPRLYPSAVNLLYTTAAFEDKYSLRCCKRRALQRNPLKPGPDMDGVPIGISEQDLATAGSNACSCAL